MGGGGVESRMLIAFMLEDVAIRWVCLGGLREKKSKRRKGNLSGLVVAS